nr:hypothetical protein [Actinomadura nitritigenes]
MTGTNQPMTAQGRPQPYGASMTSATPRARHSQTITATPVRTVSASCPVAP